MWEKYFKWVGFIFSVFKYISKLKRIINCFEIHLFYRNYIKCMQNFVHFKDLSLFF